MMKKLNINISKDGNVKLNDACGFGHGCQEATADIEALLGTADENSRATTQSAYEKVDDQILDIQRG
jgi:hypothetical protein